MHNPDNRAPWLNACTMLLIGNSGEVQCLDDPSDLPRKPIFLPLNLLFPFSLDPLPKVLELYYSPSLLAIRSPVIIPIEDGKK